MEERYNIFYVNAFSEEAFKGNPAAVYLIEEDISDEIMQKIANEIGFAETSFIKKIEDGVYNIRWFSPKCEVAVCGHATLAAAKIVFTGSKEKKIIFKSSYGEIVAEKEKELIILEFQKDIIEIPNIENIQVLMDIMGIERYKNLFVGKYTKKLIFHLNTEEEVLKLKPDFKKMLGYISDKINGVAITTESKSVRYDFITRCFNPWIGIEEDYVTGSVHTLLGSYYSDLLNKNKLLALQKSKREGEISIEINGKDKIKIKGNAYIFLKGLINKK